MSLLLPLPLSLMSPVTLSAAPTQVLPTAVLVMIPTVPYTPEATMTDATTVPANTTPGDQSERVRHLTATLIQMRDAIRDLGPLPPSPDRNRLYVAITAFTAAVMETLFRPKKPRRPSRAKAFVNDGWVGG